MRRTAFTCAVVIAACAAVQAATAGGPGVPLKWEYRVLTREQLLKLGNADLPAGLNRLGGEGWELAAVEQPGVFYFKRPALPAPTPDRVDELKARLSLAESEVEMLKDRTSWAERMVKRGFISQEQLQADRARLQAAQIQLERARGALKRAEGAAKDTPKAPKEDK
jgi:hypothetical protein